MFVLEGKNSLNEDCLFIVGALDRFSSKRRLSIVLCFLFFKILGEVGLECINPNFSEIWLSLVEVIIAGIWFTSWDSDNRREFALILGVEVRLNF